MSVASEITRLQNAKSALKTSIEAKGVTVSDSTLISGYAALVDQIQTGGGGGQAEEDLKNLIERDITTLNIPNGTTKIGNDIFSNCSELRSVTIPDSVTKIGDYAFYICRGLTSITIPNNVTKIGDSAFYQCKGLTSITIPDSVTSIGSGVFQQCSGLTSITIPNNVTKIGDSAFDDCSGLTSVTIGNSVTSIGREAFSYCSGLTSVTIQATTPPSLGSRAFYQTNNCPIYVPSESVDTYKAATNWSSLADRIQAIPTE